MSRVEVRRATPPTEVAFRHESSGKDGHAVAEETYALAAEAGGTRLTQTVVLTGLPWWVDWLMRVIHVFGTPQGDSPLVTLKATVEQDET